jgi:hypothetical protein
MADKGWFLFTEGIIIGLIIVVLLLGVFVWTHRRRG